MPYILEKKIQLSPQIFCLNGTSPIFDEPIGLIDEELPYKIQNLKSEKSIPKRNKSQVKKIKLKKKSLNLIKPINAIKSSGILIGVLMLVNRFIENLKFQVFYQNHQNLDIRHFAIINDLAMDLANKNTLNSPFQCFERQEESSFFLSKICQTFFRKFRYFLMIFSKTYEKWAFQFKNPDHNIIMIWNFFLMIFLLFLMLMIPLDASFQAINTPKSLFYSKSINYSTSFFLILDIFLRFHLGYYEEGAKILDSVKIIKRYMGKRAFCDILATFPFFISAIGTISDEPYLKLLIFFKTFRLMEILFFFEAKLCLNDFNEGLFNLIKVCCKILYIAHIIACLFHSIGSFMLSLNERSWLNLIQKAYLSNWKSRYIYSIYWSVTTLITVGYGDITPQNQYEVLFIVFVMMIGCGTFAYGINSIGSIFVIMRKKGQDFRKEAKILNNFMQRNDFDNDLKTRLREYFTYISKEDMVSDLENEQIVLNKLSSSLQHEVLLNTTGKALKKIKFLTQNFSEVFLQKLVLKMKQKLFLPEETIFEEDDFESSLFFILKGEVGLYKNQQKLIKVAKDQAFN